MTTGRCPRVVFLGSRAIGKFALEFLSRRSDIDLVGKVVLDDYKDAYWTEDPSDLSWPLTLRYEELADIDFDLGISVNYWAVVKSPILERPKMGFFNIHHSHNLMYRGLNIEVPPVSWTPEHLCSRSPQWQERTHLTLRSSGVR